MDINDIYVSLDEAREEVKKRWNDVELRKKIEDELGNNFMLQFKNEPRALLNRHLCSPDNGFILFFQCAKYIGISPLASEYQNDIFIHLNEEKKGLGRLRVFLKDGAKATIDIMDFHANEKKKLKDVVLKNGEKLLDFHHNLFEIDNCKLEMYENSAWFHGLYPPSNFYYYLLLHFVAHGVLFETFSLEERERGEAKFIEDVVNPSIEKIKNKFGLKPLVVRSYPENQTDEEDFYWWSYPSNVNDFVIKYSKKNNFIFKIYHKKNGI